MDPLTTSTDDDWNPDKQTDAPAGEPAEKKKPGRPKKEKPEVKPRQTKPIEIRTGALVNTLFCTFIYDHNLAPTISNKIKVESEIPVHDDLRSAFKQLAPHLAVIFGAMELDDLNKIQVDRQPGEEADPVLVNLNRFEVSEFKLEKYVEEETVILIGTEELPTGFAKLVTPPIRFVNSKYAHARELREAIDIVIFEIEEYLHGRKRAQDPQLELPL